jgi:hypothetical protein
MTKVDKFLSQRYYTVNQFCDKHPFITLGGLRANIFHAESNGLNNALRRIGRKILIDEDAYFDWLDSINGITPNE